MPNTDIAKSLRARLDGVRAALGPAEVNAVLITDMVNIGYVTGFTGSAGYALVSRDSALLITDARYTLRAREECPHFTVVIASGSGGYMEALTEQITSNLSLKTIGFEATKMTVSQHQHLMKQINSVEWKPTDNVVENLRAVKDSGEVAAIKRAIDVAETAFQSVKGLLKAGISERDFALELEFAMRRGGADALAFETIVASGPQSARPHHTPNSRILQSGDWVTVDWGASVDGYCSDMTRTVLIGPTTPTSEQARVYDTVLQAQRKAIAEIAPGKTGQQIDTVARDHITAAGYGDKFGHSLGHALGRVVHDGPGFSSRATDFILKPGMVLTVEPGIYIEGWGGIRIEEDIVVTETGCDVLTHLPNELEISG
jgi:Xaa-Pro aminopeptidase